ncbi:MAG TPA: hypothetical protein VNT03_16765, partial [Baekduia sp.]|nr:hypothetical protein [Baekduia sp.]
HAPGYPTSLDQTGLWVSDRLDAAGGVPEAAAGDRTEMTFTALPGTVIERMRYWRKVMKTAEDDYSAYISLGTRSNVVDSCEIAGQPLCQVGSDDWIAGDSNAGAVRYSYRDLPNISTDSIILGVVCRDDHVTHTCGNGFSLVHAEVELFSAFLTIADPMPPATGTPVGDVWSTGQWVQGTWPLTLSSSDTTGISATRVYADGSLIATLQRSCSYTRPRPCTDEPGGAVGLPTAGLADGAHEITVAAVDAAGNETRIARPTPLKVDNNPPAAPVGLSSPAATSEANSFSAHWSLPPDAGTPIVAARFQLCQVNTCGAVQTAPSLTGVDGLALPSAGTTTLRVWLVDALGHESAVGRAADLGLTYAPRAPDASPLPPAALPDPPAPPGPMPPPGPATPPRPTNPSSKMSPALEITSLRHSGHRISIRGTVSRKASGRVTVRFVARIGRRTRTLVARPQIRAKEFHATITLPSTLARVRAGTVTASYAGDADTRAASRRATIRWRD